MDLAEHAAFMQLALEQAARAGEKNEVPIGAIGVYQGEVIERGHNTREGAQDPLGHAEIHVIQQAAQRLQSWRLEELIVYVTLEPCPMCMGALLQARVPNLVFGALDPKAGACGSLYNLSNDSRFNHQIEVVSGVMEAECGKILQEFFRKLRGAK